MRAHPYAVYDAFTELPFGGSQAAIVLDAGDIDADMRLRIAKELGLPATCFVTAVSGTTVTARFVSTEREYPMCGHGTICLMTHLLEDGRLRWGADGKLEIDLILPTKKAPVEISRREDGRAMVMLEIDPPEFRNDQPDVKELASLLGLEAADIEQTLPIETAIGDFVHLVVPINGLANIQSITPDFSGITAYCRKHGFETIACYSRETVQPGCDIHVRDFCPAVGVPESAAAGTTNAALASYLIRHGLVHESKFGATIINAEQGLEIGRPSTIQSCAHLNNGVINRLQVGGVATKIIEGQLHVPI